MEGEAILIPFPRLSPFSPHKDALFGTAGPAGEGTDRIGLSVYVKCAVYLWGSFGCNTADVAQPPH